MVVMGELVQRRDKHGDAKQKVTAGIETAGYLKEKRRGVM